MRKVWLFLILALALTYPVFGQGCALCYTQAAGSGAKMIAALKNGIVVLMLPPMGICVLLTWIGYRKRNKFYSIEGEKESGGPNSKLGW